MKQIEKIFIDLDDEITFVVERIRNSDKSRVLLVVPDRAALISSIVSLKIVLRHCVKSDKALVLVTSDELGYSLSQKAGIVTVMKVSQIDDGLWDRAYDVLEKKKKEFKRNLESSSKNLTPANKSVESEEKIVGVAQSLKDKTEANSINRADEDNNNDELDSAGKKLPGGTRKIQGENLKKQNVEQGEIVGEGEVDEKVKKQTREVESASSQENVVKDIISGAVVAKSASKSIKDKKVTRNSSSVGRFSVPETQKKGLEISEIGGFEFVAGGDIAKIKKKVVRHNDVAKSGLVGGAVSAGSVAGMKHKKIPTSSKISTLQSVNKTKSSVTRSAKSVTDDQLGTKKVEAVSKDTSKSKPSETKQTLGTQAKIKEPITSVPNTSRLSRGIVGRDITGMKFKGKRTIKSPKKTGYKPKYIKHHSAKSGKSKRQLPINISKKYLVVGFGVFLMFLVYAYSFAPSAALRVDVETRPISVSKDIKAVPNLEQIDLEKLNIPADVIEVKVTGSKTGKATGKKKTGEVAKGEVTLFNKTGKEMSLPAGTYVVAGNRKFTTDVSVNIPAKSVVKTIDGDTTIFGSVDVNVTAANFGEEYNLGEGTEFLVEGYGSNEIVGKTFKGFSGGTTIEFTVVSKEDVDKLKAEIIKELKPTAIEEVKKKIGGDNFFLENDIEFKADEVVSSPKIGEKADKFDLSVIATAKVTSFSNQDLDDLANKLTESLVSEGFNLNPDSLKVESKLLKQDGETLVVNLKIDALTTRNISKDDILNNVAGKGYKDAEEFLKNNDSIKDYSLVLQPSWLFGPFKHMPSSPAKIDLTLNYVGVEDNS